ncbi:Inactive protein RESTRICTED TEV MOVEMENT 2 [Spatholobus suberectus]|nr:Inactive protein RESTRICTED TEV MOVEMENT 2 [Spatholobus suberectus]
MGNNPSSEAVKRVYEDFDPLCKWHDTKDHTTIDIDLKDFKKQQIQVKIEGGYLVITGEQALHRPKWKRFRKEIKLKREWNKNGINAELSSSGTLSIKIPKRETFDLKFWNSLSTVTSKMIQLVPPLQLTSANFLYSIGVQVLVLILLTPVVVSLCFYYICCLCNTNTYT